MKNTKVDVVIIATNKYSKFVNPLIESIRRHFMTNCKVKINLFSDQQQDKADMTYIIPPYGFPEATLFRYKIFTEYRGELDGDYIFYMDVDSLIIGPVEDDILIQGLTVTRHPGFYRSNDWGSPGCDKKSLAWLPKDKWKAYYCGGFQGGSRSHYLLMCSVLAKRIEDDESRGVRAVWHDESHVNHFLNCGDYNMEVKVLSPSYMMPESRILRKRWGLDSMEIKILALDKNHEEIRK